MKKIIIWLKRWVTGAKKKELAAKVLEDHRKAEIHRGLDELFNGNPEEKARRNRIYDKNNDDRRSFPVNDEYWTGAMIDVVNEGFNVEDICKHRPYSGIMMVIDVFIKHQFEYSIKVSVNITDEQLKHKVRNNAKTISYLSRKDNRETIKEITIDPGKSVKIITEGTK